MVKVKPTLDQIIKVAFNLDRDGFNTLVTRLANQNAGNVEACRNGLIAAFVPSLPSALVSDLKPVINNFTMQQFNKPASLTTPFYAGLNAELYGEAVEASEKAAKPKIDNKAQEQTPKNVVKSPVPAIVESDFPEMKKGINALIKNLNNITTKESSDLILNLITVLTAREYAIEEAEDKTTAKKARDEVKKLFVDLLSAMRAGSYSTYKGVIDFINSITPLMMKTESATEKTKRLEDCKKDKKEGFPRRDFWTYGGLKSNAVGQVMKKPALIGVLKHTEEFQTLVAQEKEEAEIKSFVAKEYADRFSTFKDSAKIKHPLAKDENFNPEGVQGRGNIFTFCDWLEQFKPAKKEREISPDQTVKMVLPRFLTDYSSVITPSLLEGKSAAELEALEKNARAMIAAVEAAKKAK